MTHTKPIQRKHSKRDTAANALGERHNPDCRCADCRHARFLPGPPTRPRGHAIRTTRFEGDQRSVSQKWKVARVLRRMGKIQDIRVKGPRREPSVLGGIARFLRFGRA